MFYQGKVTEGSVESMVRKKNGKIMFAFNGGIFNKCSTDLDVFDQRWNELGAAEKSRISLRDGFDFFPGTRLS